MTLTPRPRPPRPGTKVSRGTIADLCLLGLLAALFYLPGLDHHGVTNWQEAQRLTVARDMQVRFNRGEGIAALVVPTVYGKPYLAKPPLLYWTQLALSQPFGQRVQLWHLRLAVALAGIAGVLATYVCTRVFFDRPGAPARTPARWSALLLATGLLSTRSARIGELDALLMPLCTLAIACIARAWTSHRERGRTSWAAVLGASVFTTLAVLVKDPAVMVVGLGGFAAMAIFYASSGGTDPRPASRRLRIGAACLAGLVAGSFAARTIAGPMDVLGAALSGAGIGLVVYALLPLTRPDRVKALMRALSRTHPLIVLGVPVAIRLGWSVWVDHLLGRTIAGTLAKVEAEDNLRLFIAEAPINNIEAALYGVGLGSVAAAAVLIWTVRHRPRLSPSAAHLVAWIGLGLLAFSILGKGVPRYLTPLWPAIAIVGGWGLWRGFAAIPRRPTARAPWVKPALAAVLLLLGAGQTAWYAYGRELIEGERTPKAMMSALREQCTRRERRRVFSFEFTTPALDYHLGRRVRPLGDVRVTASMLGGVQWPLSRLRGFLSRPTAPPRTAIILVRDRPIEGVDPALPVDRLRAAGFTLEPITLPAGSEFKIDRGRTRVLAFRASLPRHAEAPESRQVSP